jgi:hypothetical protein
VSDQEEWRPIPGSAGRYEISTHGRIRSLWFKNRVCDILRPTPLILKLTIEDDGYRRAAVMIHGRRKFIFVHRSMLETFVGAAPTPEHETGHVDGDPSHNYLGNLKWVTQLENAEMRETHGHTARGERHGFSKLTAKKVKAIKRLLADGEPQRVVAAKFGIGQATVWRIKRSQAWSHV